MSHSARLFVAVAAALACRLLQAQASEPVQVYTMPPTLVAERDDLARTIAVYPARQSLWNTMKSVALTYTVRQSFSGLITPDPCEGLPIQVRVVNGHLRSATYGASGGKCVAGAPVSTKGLYLTPSAFFSRIVEARKQLECYASGLKGGCLPTALRVTFDDKYGFPVKMEDYSVELSDYYWSLEVTNITAEP